MIIKNKNNEIIVNKKPNKNGILNLSYMDLTDAILVEANLKNANLSFSKLQGANLAGADLSSAYLLKANLTKANLNDANLSWAIITKAKLIGASLERANLTNALLNQTNLKNANLSYAILLWTTLIKANLKNANLTNAILTEAVLNNSILTNTKGLIKPIGVEPGNYYWKRFDAGLNNKDYQFKVGLNKLRDGEIFNNDPRVLCAYPGFHFASKSWCAVNYPNRPLEALIKIPEKAEVNEPYATNGKASANMIEIIKIYDTRTGEDVTEKYQ